MKLTRRQFTTAAVATALGAQLSWAGRPQSTTQPLQAARAPITLPPLGYAFDALEPHIDAQTMQLHHDRHHQAAVIGLNAALEKHPELGGSLEELLSNPALIPEDIRTAVRNNGGSHFNHSLFWDIMTPGGAKAPTGVLQGAIEYSFGSTAKLTEQLNAAASSRFGSGWAWLIWRAGKLEVISTPNQDTPLELKAVPVLGVDVWEHAYYLKYQNKRADYLKAWWNVINWDKASQRYEAARRGP